MSSRPGIGDIAGDLPGQFVTGIGLELSIDK